MKIRFAFIIVGLLIIAPPLPADNLELYKNCQVIYQNLQARKHDIIRITTTIDYHKKVFHQYKQSNKNNHANFHKRYQDFLKKLLSQQQKQYRGYETNYRIKCPYFNQNPVLKHHLNDVDNNYFEIY